MDKKLGRKHTYIQGRIFVPVLVGMIKMCLKENGDSLNKKIQALMDSFKVLSIKLVAMSVQEAGFPVTVFLCGNCAQIKFCTHL